MRLLSLLLLLLGVCYTQANPEACAPMAALESRIKADFGAEAPKLAHFMSIVNFLESDAEAPHAYSTLPAETNCGLDVPDRLCAYTNRALLNYRQRGLPGEARLNCAKDRIAVGSPRVHTAWMQSGYKDLLALCLSSYETALQT